MDSTLVVPPPPLPHHYFTTTCNFRYFVTWVQPKDKSSLENGIALHHYAKENCF